MPNKGLAARVTPEDVKAMTKKQRWAVFGEIMRAAKGNYDPYMTMHHMGLSARTFRAWCNDPEFLEIMDVLQSERMAKLDTLAWSLALGSHPESKGKPDAAMIRHIQNLDAKMRSEKADRKSNEAVGALFAETMKNMSPEQKAIEAEKATVVMERRVAVKDAKRD